MARNKKIREGVEEVDEVIENATASESEPFEESVDEPVKEKSIEEPAEEESKEEVEVEFKQEREPVWLDPFEVRLPKDGAFLFRIGSDVVFQTDDGNKWVIPFRAEHAKLKAGDRFTF